MSIFSKSIEEAREHFPVTRQWAYLETASTGLIPDFVYDGVRHYIDNRYLSGGDSRWKYADMFVDTLEMMRRSKASLAQMINCNADCIAFGQSATQLFTLVTEGIDYAPGDNIVTVKNGWIGSRYAWQKRQSEGLDVRFVEDVNGVTTVESLINACDENTRAIAVNWVEGATGFRLDMESLGRWCHSHNILLFVDAVQALGVMDIDIKRCHIDFLTGSDYKWMMGFCGTGFAYISPYVHTLIKHWGAGWMSDTDRFNTHKDQLNIREDAGRFEIGHQHIDGIYGLGLVAEQYRILDRHKIESYVLDLAAYFRRLARETDGVWLANDFEPVNCSQIVLIGLNPGLKITDENFKKAKVFTHTDFDGINKQRQIRVGLHYYNNRDDVDRFFHVIHKRNGIPK